MSKLSRRPGREQIKEQARKKNANNAGCVANTVKPG